MKFIFPYNISYYIYRILNLINNEVYIGRTRRPDYRFRQHVLLSEHPEMHSRATKIHFIINKYGSENFIFEVFEECKNYKDSYDREKFWIKFYHADQDGYGYNGICGPKGPMWSYEDRILISQRTTGINNPMYGKHHSVDTKNKLSLLSKNENNPFFGKKHSEESKMKIGISSSKRNAGSSNPNAKLSNEIIFQIKNDWQTGNFKKCELAIKYNVSAATIGNIVNGKTWIIK